MSALLQRVSAYWEYCSRAVSFLRADSFGNSAACAASRVVSIQVVAVKRYAGARTSSYKYDRQADWHRIINLELNARVVLLGTVGIRRKVRVRNTFITIHAKMV